MKKPKPSNKAKRKSEAAIAFVLLPDRPGVGKIVSIEVPGIDPVKCIVVGYSTSKRKLTRHMKKV